MQIYISLMTLLSIAVMVFGCMSSYVEQSYGLVLSHKRLRKGMNSYESESDGSYEDRSIPLDSI